MSTEFDDLKRLVKKLPKAELHAHLNGSVSRTTIANIVERKMKSSTDANAKQLADAFFDGCKNASCMNYETIFSTQFNLLRQLCSDDETICEISHDVVKEFADDNVAYLELRSTPKDNPSTGMTKRSYIEAMIKGIETATADRGGSITTNIVLSVDRSRSLQDAWETLRLAEEYATSDRVPLVGLDSCGDPYQGKLMDFVPVFESAKRQGLKTTMHLLEVPGQYEETAELFQRFIPDRLGHAIYLHSSPSDFRNQVHDVAVQHRIPIEICLTSNLLAQAVTSYENSHFTHWRSASHPICLCTDDKGLFDTTLSQEYEIAATTFHLSPAELWSLSYQTLDFIFATQHTVSALQQQWLDCKKEFHSSVA